jgi:hypothetical protein
MREGGFIVVLGVARVAPEGTPVRAHDPHIPLVLFGLCARN